MAQPSGGCRDERSSVLRKGDGGMRYGRWRCRLAAGAVGLLFLLGTLGVTAPPASAWDGRQFHHMRLLFFGPRMQLVQALNGAFIPQTTFTIIEVVRINVRVSVNQVVPVQMAVADLIQPRLLANELIVVEPLDQVLFDQFMNPAFAFFVRQVVTVNVRFRVSPNQIVVVPMPMAVVAIRDLGLFVDG
jgi:hypothetical protein